MSTSENNTDASKAQLLIRKFTMRRPTLLALLSSLLSSSLVACVAPVGGNDSDRTPVDPDNKSACASKPASSVKSVTDDVTIRTAADWDDLPDGCWDLKGKLTLQGDAVTSIATLDKLVAVDELEIVDTKLTTLDAPIYVYESVSITGNAQLTSLDDLVIDQDIGVDIEIDDNAALTGLGGIADLEKLSGDLTITRNAKLPALELRKLTEVTGSTRIANNTALASIDLGKLETLARFEVLDNAALTSIGSLPAREIAGDVTIRGNAKLTTLGTMSSLERISGALTIDNNAALATIGMFTTSMRYVSTVLTISNNPQLTSLGQVAHLQAIGGVTVTSNTKLPFCAAQEINHCVPSHGTVTIANNNNATMTCTCWCE
jgi:hypothetical protein